MSSLLLRFERGELSPCLDVVRVETNGLPGVRSRLAQPALLPLARQAFLFLSKQRGRLSKWFIRGGTDGVKKRLGPELYATCALNRDDRSRKLRDGNPPGSLLR